MKKLLYLAFALAITGLTFDASAQCTPDPQYTAAGVYPDSATGLPTAVAGVAYSEVMTIVVPVDTVLPPVPIPVAVDSIVITDVMGLPNGFTYTCAVPNCAFPGGQSNCLVLEGNPVLADTGSYPLTVVLAGYAAGTGIPIPGTVDFYTLNIDATVGYGNVELEQFSLRQNYPNPVTENSSIRFNAPVNGNYQFEVIDMLGKTIESRSVIAQAGSNVIRVNANDYGKGVYMYSLTNGVQKLTRRMIVK